MDAVLFLNAWTAAMLTIIVALELVVRWQARRDRGPLDDLTRWTPRQPTWSEINAIARHINRGSMGKERKE